MSSVVLSEEQWLKVQQCMRSAKAIMGHSSEEQGLFRKSLETNTLSLSESLPAIQELLARQKNAEDARQEERENSQKLQKALADYATSLASGLALSFPLTIAQIYTCHSHHRRHHAPHHLRCSVPFPSPPGLSKRANESCPRRRPLRGNVRRG